MSENIQEKQYSGLLGLDNIHPALKATNFLVSIIIGIMLAFKSWFQALAFNRAIYDFEPFSWPLIFLLAWPLCAVILWLRLTGLKWRWGFLAGVLVVIIYFVLSAILNAIARMMS